MTDLHDRAIALAREIAPCSSCHGGGWIEITCAQCPELHRRDCGACGGVGTSPEAVAKLEAFGVAEYNRGSANSKRNETMKGKNTAHPPLAWSSNGEAGDGQHICSGCGTERDEPHTWPECVEELRASTDAAWNQVGQLDEELRSARERIAELEWALRECPHGCVDTECPFHRRAREVLKK